MIRLALLLLGPDFIRRRWHVLALIGSLWAALGVGIFIDALDGDVYFPVHVFGYLLILEALVTLIATTSNLGTQTVLRKSRGALFLIVGLLMVSPYRSASFILALLFGLAIGVDGLLRTSAAWVVRFPGWQGTQAGEREIKKALRKALFKYKLHADEELFEKAYSYIRQYY